MREKGEVIKTENENATVRISRSSACGKCGMCGMTEEQKHVDISLPNTLSAKQGDWVEIEINENASLKVTLIIYLIPLLIALAAMLLAYAFSAPEWVLLVVFVVALGGGFLVVRLIDKKYSKKLDIIPKMVSVIKENKDE